MLNDNKPDNDASNKNNVITETKAETVSNLLSYTRLASNAKTITTYVKRMWNSPKMSLKPDTEIISPYSGTILKKVDRT